jgi:L-fuculose-phosphate aldolase
VSLSAELLIKKQIISAGRQLAESGLVCAGSGNLSARLGSGGILITATGTRLGNLKYGDIVKVGLSENVGAGIKRRPSSELPTHRLIYRNLSCRVVIHCHPPLTNAYFAVLPELKVLTFETQFYLGKVPVVGQKGLNVTRPEAIIRALRNNSIVVARNHGVFSIGDNFRKALEKVLILEEAVKVSAIARLFKKRALDRIDREIKKCLLARK